MARRPLLELLGPHQGRQGGGHGVQLIRQGPAALFLIFERIPAIYTGVPGSRGCKDVGVAKDQLFAHFPADIREGAAALLFFQHRVEYHLHQHVPQLFPQHPGVVCVDGLQSLAGLFQEVFADGLVGLDLVPGAAILRVAQDADDLDQILRRIVLLFGPVDHAAFSFSAGFSSTNPSIF